jgi:branched-chain amino acid transport system substrate-binding protein
MKQACKRKGKKGIFTWMALSIVALISFVCCVQVSEAAKEIKVGIVVGLTGGASSMGKHAWNSYQMIFDELNSTGGIKSMGGAKIKYTVMDHQTKADIAGSNAEKLIRDGVSVIFGANFSDAAMVASQVSQRAKVPFIDTTDGDVMITGRGFDYVFQTNPNIHQLDDGALKFTQWISKKTGKIPKKVAILNAQMATGYAGFKYFEEILPKYYDVVFKTTYPTSQQDFAGIVKNMKNLGVEYVFQFGMAADAIMITRAYKEMDFNPMGYIGVSGGHYNIDYIEGLGKDAEYTFCTTYFTSDLKVPKIKDLVTRYKGRFGVDFDATDATVANGVSVLVDSLERAGTDNPTKLKDALKATNLNVGQYWYVVPDGCKFDEKNRNIKQHTVTFQIRDGKQQAVYPEGYGAIDPVFPIPAWSKR